MSAKNDAAFLRMFLMVLGGLVAFTVIILILANLVISSVEEGRGEDPRQRAAVAKRIQPVGTVNVAAVAKAPAAPKSGAEVVAAACNSCHIAGVLGAPKIGDKAAWEQRLAAQGGLDGLTASAIAGKGGMPPRGGAMVSDGEIRAAIEDMMANSGVDSAAAAPSAPVAASAPETPATGPVSTMTAMAGGAADAAGEAVDAAKSMVAAAVPAPAPESAPPAPKPAAAEAVQALAQAKGCMACHQLAIKVVGPAYKDVAAKYKDQADAAAKLAVKVKGGGVGTWGQIPMPPQPTLTDDEVNALVAWVLAQ